MTNTKNYVSSLPKKKNQSLDFKQVMGPPLQIATKQWGGHLFLPKLLIFIPPLHMSTQAPFYLLFMQTNRSIQQFNWSYSIWSKELYRFPTNSIILFSQQILSPQTKSTLILFLFWVKTNQLILDTHNFKTITNNYKKKRSEIPPEQKFTNLLSKNPKLNQRRKLTEYLRVGYLLRAL